MSYNESKYLDYLDYVAKVDIEHLLLKEKSYGNSWKRRGGIGAFMMAARKWDRIENLLGKATWVLNRSRGGKENLNVQTYNIFAHIEANSTGEDSSVLAEVRDLRRYLMLVEAEMMAQGVLIGVPSEHNKPGTPDDGGHHAQYVDGKVNAEPTVMDGQRR